MHALLAHAYHLLLVPAHLAARPVWRSLALCVATAMAGRLLAKARGILLAAVPVVLAWAVLAPTAGWPPAPVARLAGLGVIALGAAMPGEQLGRFWLGLASAGLSAWWLRGAPFDWADIAECVPAAVGLAGGFAAADRLARHDGGAAAACGAVALAAGLWLAGAAPHWAHAALAPACAAAILFGVPGAAPMLARMTVCVAAAALVASDRGRVVTVDLACLAPLPVWAAASLRTRGRTA